jgi:hypothetical protein
MADPPGNAHRPDAVTARRPVRAQPCARPDFFPPSRVLVSTLAAEELAQEDPRSLRQHRSLGLGCHTHSHPLPAKDR